MINYILQTYKKGQARFVNYVLNEIINCEFFDPTTDLAYAKKNSAGETILTILFSDFDGVKTQVFVDMLPEYYKRACLYEKERSKR